VLADLVAEQQSLDDIVAGHAPTTVGAQHTQPRLVVADQIGHLTYFDGTAALAITDPDAFTEQMTALLAVGGARRVVGRRR
jgi:hypothetical protein